MRENLGNSSRIKPNAPNLMALRSIACLLTLLALTGCSPRRSSSSGTPSSTKMPASLIEARKGFKSELQPGPRDGEPVEKAPPKIFRTVKYSAPVGKLSAYVTPDPGDGKKHPAIIWIAGGDCNSIGDVWTPNEVFGDQNATAYRKAGLILMFPSLRGGNQNPGTKEGFLGEVDDVLAARKCLAAQKYVDPQRIYLGGHSTGGTLALLVAECTGKFRAVFAFGPAGDVSGYGGASGYLPFNMRNKKEIELRSPGYWLHCIKSQTYVIEGTEGNIEPLRAMDEVSDNPRVHFIAINGMDHFSILRPTNEFIAKKIVKDTGPTCNISISEEEVNQVLSR